MKSEITEFSYGYAVTEEILKLSKGRVTGAPFFPTLYAEGNVGGGYDVKLPLLGSPIFLQFKLSEFLNSSNAKEYVSKTLKTPYYRMHIRSRRYSLQHDLLINLEKSGEHVRYIAPEFYTIDDFNRYYIGSAVVKNSALFSPVQIGSLSADNHYVVFQRGTRTAYVCSENPESIDKLNYHVELESLGGGSGEVKKINEQTLLKIENNLIDCYERVIKAKDGPEYKIARNIKEAIEGKTVFERIGVIARVLYGLEFYVVTTLEPK